MILNRRPHRFLNSFFGNISPSQVVGVGLLGYKWRVDEIDSHFEALRKGSPEAWSACYQEMGRVATIAIYSIAHNPTESVVKVAAREAISKMWEKRDKPSKAAKFRGYLRTIAKNNYLNLMAQQQKAPVPLEEIRSDAMPPALVVHDPPADPEGMTEDELLDEALRQMDPQQHALIKARYLEHKTQEVVGSELGIPLGSMTYEERRALTELKRIILRLRNDKDDYE